MRLPFKLGWLLAGSLFAAASAQADVYRWVDEHGRVNFADAVPDRYRASATRVSTRPLNIVAGSPASASSAADRRDAADGRPQGGGAAALSGRAASATAGRIDAPAPPDCAQLWQAYFDSQACFAPYHIVGGAVKPEAYAICPVVPDPNRGKGCPLPVTSPGSR